MTTTYSLMFASRKFFPDEITAENSDAIAAELETLVARHSKKFRAVSCDVMTDQIDVFIVRKHGRIEKIATYMA